MNDAILITGGAGFIGSHLCWKTVRDPRLDGIKTVVIDDESGGHESNLNPFRGRFHKGSVCDKEFVDSIFEQYNVRYVLHFAAYAAEGLSHYIRRFNYENNVLGSMNVINASIRHGVERFVFASSAAVYGHGGAWPDKESDPCEPIDPYGVAKLAVEQDLRCAAKSHGLKSTIFRMHNVYGERQNLADRYRNVVGIFVRAALEGRRMPVFGLGYQERQFTYVGDIMEPIIGSLFRDDTVGETYNLGTDKSMSVDDLVKCISGIAGIPIRIEQLPPRDEAKAVVLDHTKSKQAFGDYATTTLQEGAEKMWSYHELHFRFRALPPAERFGAIEIEKGLPEVWLRS